MALSLHLLPPFSENERRNALLRLGVEGRTADRLAAAAGRRLFLLRNLPLAVAEEVRQLLHAAEIEAAVMPRVLAGQADAVLLASSADWCSLRKLFTSGSAVLDQLTAELDRYRSNSVGPPPVLQGKGCHLELDRPRIMGILNVTPDSFSDGGRFFHLEQAMQHALRMIEEGADILDIGGESTRPGAAAVTEKEELARVVPVIEALRRETAIPISIDTTKSAVARAAVAAGADFINDISGLRFDPEMAATAAESGAGLFLMHTRGRPEEMQKQTGYQDLIGEVLSYLEEGLALARRAGVAETKIAIDPGIGFGKDLGGNLEILRRLEELHLLGRPILLGTSRKSFIGRILGQSEPDDRLYGTLATIALGVEKGASIFRVHDVRPAREVALTAWTVVRGGERKPD